MLSFALERDIDLSSLSLMFNLFNKLIEKNNIVEDKSANLYCACCVLLVIKFEENGEQLRDYITPLTETFRTNLKDLLQNEITIFSLLRFSLFCQPTEVLNYFSKINQFLQVCITNMAQIDC